MKPRNYKDETSSLREARRLRKMVFNKINQEKLFPKRSRWQYAEPIFRQTLGFYQSVIEANDPNVQTEELRDRRYTLQQIAIGKLSALDALICAAQEDYELPAREFESVAGQINECMRLLHAWVSADIKRYGLPNEADKYRG